MKGVGLAGAWSLLYEHGYRPKRVASYPADDWRDIVLAIDFRQFEDRGRVGAGLSLLFNEGIFEGRRFYEWMRELLGRQGVHTFADLRTPEGDSRLQVMASDLSARDAARLGFDSPLELEVALAVRMSMSLPLFFEPVRTTESDGIPRRRVRLGA